MMNRRRIGLAALVLGVAAAARQRMKTQVDPGPDPTPSKSNVATADEAAAPSEPVGTSSSLAVPADPAPAVTLSLGDPEIDAGGGASSLGDPEIDAGGGASSLGDPEIDAGGGASSLGDPEIDAGGGASSLGDPEIDAGGQVSSLGDPEIDAVGQVSPIGTAHPAASVADSEPVPSSDDTIPAIVLPTMPTAGTQPTTGTQSENEAAATAKATAANEGPEGLPPATLPLPTTIPVTLAESQVATTTRAATGVTADSSPLAGVGAPALPDMLISPDTPGGEAPKGDASAGKESFRKVHRIWSIVGSILLGLVVVAVIAGAVVPLPYYSLEPGSVYDTIERVEAPGDLVSIPSGEIGFVTVAQTANITGWQWLDAKLDNNVRIRHEDEVRGDQTAEELREADVRRMQVSKDAAVVVALRKLGFDLVITPIGIEVAQVFDCTAADGTLGTGDLIVGVNGVEVLSGEQLVEQLMGQTIGAEVDLLVERIDPTNPTQSMRTDLVAIALGSADAACLPDDVRAEDPRPFIGIGTLPMFDEEFPIDIDVRTGAVSGPSAGLAFTLAIMDVLSEGELTNGLSVVATGTIDRDGNVGPVGGIQQKTVAAQRSGADVFLVPLCCDNFVDRTSGEPLDVPGNYDEALLYDDGDMMIIGVNTLDEALAALGELGGDVDSFLEQEAP